MNDLDKTIKPIQIPSGNESAGLGYITIPNVEDIDREQFIEDCYRSHTVCISGGIHYGIFYNVAIDKEVLKNVIFPKEKGQKGSPIVWVNIPPWNKPVIIAVLKYEDEYYLNEEGSMNHSREFEGNNIDFSTQAKNGQVTFAMKTRAGVPGLLKIDITNPDKTCSLDVYIRGKAKIHASEELKLVSDKKFIVHVLNEKSEDKVVIEYEAKKGFSYKDEFGNTITCKDGEIKIDSKKINHNSGKEPMVLGDTLQNLLEELIQAINKLTVPTAFGPSGTPINKAEFNSIKNKLKNFKSKISNLD